MKKLLVFLFMLFLANISFAQDNGKNCLESFPDSAYEISDAHELVQTISIHYMTCKDEKIPLSKTVPIQEEWRVEINKKIIDTLPKELWSYELKVWELIDLVKGKRIRIQTKNPYPDFSFWHAPGYVKKFYYNGKNIDYIIEKNIGISIGLHFLMFLIFLAFFLLLSIFVVKKDSRKTMSIGALGAGIFYIFIWKTGISLTIQDWLNLPNLLLATVGIIIFVILLIKKLRK